MNKTNIQAFEDGVIEVRFILTDEAIELLKKSGYNELLTEYNYALKMTGCQVHSVSLWLHSSLMTKYARQSLHCSHTFIIMERISVRRLPHSE